MIMFLQDGTSHKNQAVREKEIQGTEMEPGSMQQAYVWKANEDPEGFS